MKESNSNLSFLKKIRESLRDPAQPKRTIQAPQTRRAKPAKKKINHKFVDFTTAYRIGILSTYSEQWDRQKSILNYKKKLEQLGFECEVLLFVNAQEKSSKVYLPSFNLSELNKELLPSSPRTDRFKVRKFDLLFNMYMEPCPQLLYLSNESNARCRVSPYLDFLMPCSDILIPTSTPLDIDAVIATINNILKIQPYVRPQI